MARVFDLDFSGARLLSRDFGGQKFGPDQRQFKVAIDDPGLIAKLKSDGAPIWCPEKRDEDDLPSGYLSV